MATSLFLRELNIAEQCREYRVPLLSCPHFLFLIMGFVIVTAIVATNITAKQYTDPEVAALIVLIVTAILLVISHVIIHSFERIADAARARAEFVSIASHQLRSPLTSIKWQLELLLQDASLQGKTRANITALNEHNNRMIKLVNDLLEVNRIENNRIALRPTPLSLVDLTQKSLDAFHAPATNFKVSLKLSAPQNLPLAYADEMHLRWVLENLIDNAVRYSHPNMAVEISIKKQGKNLLWSVTNTGVGIAPEDYGRVFQKFFRGEGPLKLRPEGSGLGLFVARSIIEASKGKIGFSSKNDFTTFWFTLPIAVPHTGPDAAAAPEETMTAPLA